MSELRLSKLMAQRGICSRREADHYIAQGWVSVDGKVIDQLGSKVHPHQSIELSSKAKASQQNKVTVLLNKPVGYVSGSPEPGYKPTAALIKLNNCAHQPPAGLFKDHRLDTLAPAGRLDIDSVGLLVLTQDGRIARALVGPDSSVEKEYLVRFQGSCSNEKLSLLCHGLHLDGRRLKPATVTRQNKDQLKFILIEGRKRQIRRMCEQVGLAVVKLQRVRIGNVKLGALPLGKWRLLKPGERF